MNKNNNIFRFLKVLALITFLFTIIPYCIHSQIEMDLRHNSFSVFFSDNDATLIIEFSRNYNINNISINMKSAFASINLNLKDFNNSFKYYNSKKVFKMQIPINGNYSATITDALEKSSTSMTFLAENTYIFNPHQTQMFCIGNESRNRWCRAKNIGLINRKFVFFSPYNIKINPVKFLVITSRTFLPFFYGVSTRDIMFYKSIPKDCPFENTPVQISYEAIDQTWHYFTEKYLPTFWTMTSHLYNITDEEYNNSDLVDSDYGEKINMSWKIMDFSSSKKTLFFEFLTNQPILQPPKQLTCYKDLYIGLRKTFFYKDYRPKGWLLDYNRYNYDILGIRGYRDHIINLLDVQNVSTPSNSHPIVLIVRRRGKKRIINNFDKLVNVTRELCPFCLVKPVYFEDYTLKQQILMSLNASIVIGVHGSGLTNGYWMKPSSETHPTCIVEFIPYRYDCRPWYKNLAELLDIQHIGIETPRNYTIPINGYSLAYLDSASEKDRCLNIKISDNAFRDQNLNVCLELYIEKLSPLIEKLRKLS